MYSPYLFECQNQRADLDNVSFWKSLSKKNSIKNSAEYGHDWLSFKNPTHINSE